MSDLDIPLPDGADGDGAESVEGVERTSVLAATPTAALAEVLDALEALDPVPGLAPLLRWAPAGEGVSLVHRLPLGARSLAEVRAEGPLRLGVAAALGRGILGPVRGLHAAGLAHGAIGADSVLLAPDGAPVLAGTGLGWAAPPGHVDGPDPATDVAALAELVRHLVGATPLPSGLVLVLLRCGDDDPRLRPTLDDLDRALAACQLAGDEPRLAGDEPRLAAAGPEPDGAAATPGGGTRPGPALRPDLADPPQRRRSGRRVRSPGTSAGPVPRASVRRTAADVPDPVDAGGARGSSFLDRPRVLRPTEGGSRRRRGGRPRPRGGLVLVGAALVGALLVARAAAAPAVADGPQGAMALRSASAVPSRPSPSEPAAGSVASPVAPPVATPTSVAAPLPPSATRGEVTGSPASGAATAPPGPAGGQARTGRDAVTVAPAPAADPSRTVAPGGARATVDWVAVLTRLDRVRHDALVAGSRERLARAVDRAGPAWAADAALADRVRDRGARLEGGEVEVLAAEPVSVSGRTAEVVVVDTRAAYAVTLDGATARVPARGATTWTLLLTRAADGAWRIHDVRAAT